MLLIRQFCKVEREYKDGVVITRERALPGGNGVRVGKFYIATCES